MLRSDPLARPTANDLLNHPLLLSESESRLRAEQLLRVRAEAELQQAQRRIAELEQALAALTNSNANGAILHEVFIDIANSFNHRRILITTWHDFLPSIFQQIHTTLEF